VDDDDAIVAISLRVVGNIWWLIVAIGGAGAVGFICGHMASRTILRKYVVFFRRNPASIGEALRSGEDQQIEFKRGLVEGDLLKSVTAFANTNDGTIFVGVDDHGKICGLDVGTPKGKETFRHKLNTQIRNRIKPLLLTKIEFEELRGYWIAKIFVPRGDEQLYFLDGVIYARYGESDVQAEPAIVKQILATYR